MMLSTCRYAVSQPSRLMASTTTSYVTPAIKLASSAAKNKVAIAPARRLFSSSSSTTTTTTTASASSNSTKSGWWHSAELWGGFGALAGWGMSLSAFYDAYANGPEVISLTMTPVLIVYSSLFARWAWVVQPRNLLLCGCHLANITAQVNQLRRAIEYKMNNGQEDEATKIMQQAALGGALLAGSVAAGPTVQSLLTKSDYGVISRVAAGPAGPFTGTSYKSNRLDEANQDANRVQAHHFLSFLTVHFWAPMSKWMISGASFFDLQRPTDKISLPQYSALTLTGFFFSRYALLVSPVNYALCSVNIALFGSSAWHLGRKVNADYLHFGTTKQDDDKTSK
jgi:hypothetical protein